MQIDNSNSALFYKSILWAYTWCHSNPDGYATMFASDGEKFNQECKTLPYFLTGVALGEAKSKTRSDPPARGRGIVGGVEKATQRRRDVSNEANIPAG